MCEIKDTVIYFTDLLKSIEKSGNYLLFTCSCGVADCGGWDYVEITHTDKTISWRFFYQKEYYFEFQKIYYISELKRVAFELNQSSFTIYPQDGRVIMPE